MPRHVKNVGELIAWQYAKLICQSAFGCRDDYGFIMSTYKRLVTGRIKPSTILRENKLLVLHGEQCVYCGISGQFEWEHIIPLSRGGPDTIDNLVRACGQCNRSKGARDPIEWYGTKRIGELPRLVMGKLLKLVHEAHDRRGTLTSPVTGKSSIDLPQLTRVFHEVDDTPQTVE
ncbi:CRISPR-associated endonuclease Cas9 [Maioricimonas rarisocia]|uniref:CRISPR-associated endonuclease Cas9 n=1 Tax=Maioricimonas rarisocia TaxID=2528026 RepID=A0A517ZGB8_9PLAN|nr:HNH endonuclease [Maioricimonas rarisocia]QDU41501.1 CRISPR-associated endonuclease Cas9 [Maioricimonas rarisocia]